MSALEVKEQLTNQNRDDFLSIGVEKELNWLFFGHISKTTTNEHKAMNYYEPIFNPIYVNRIRSSKFFQRMDLKKALQLL